MKNYKLYIVALLLTLILQETNINAQQAGWIEQDLSQTMSGQRLPNRGDDVLIFTTQYSEVVYFFDIRVNVWTEANLGSQQFFNDALGSGNTVFAYSDEYIIAYSSILSQWDTVKYLGNVLDPSGTSTRRGYGCGDKLAYFITDANIFYAFDSELAEWKEYNFGIVTNASGFNDFWVADVYSGAILGRNGSDYAKNIAYSLVTHSFAELDQGGWYYYPDKIMHGGYVSTWGDGITYQKYFGYSAFTNQFNEVSLPAGFGVFLFEAGAPLYYNLLEDIYVFTCGYEVGDQFNRDAFVRSYSTKTGNWYSLNYSYDPNDITGTSWRRGGSFSVGNYYYNTDLSVSVWKFYGNSGTHIGENTDLFGSQALFVCGGTVAVGTGEHNLWFHNFETGNTKHEYFTPNPNIYYAQHLGAENYCCVFRVNTTTDIMRVFFFNGITNKVQSIETYKLPTSNESATPRVYGYVTGGPNNEVIFYSEQKDSLIIYQAAEAYGGLKATNYLMVHSLPSSTSVIFDASTAQIYEKNFSINANGIGNNIIFARSGDMELTAFSGLTKIWTTQQTNEVINAMHVGDEIAVGGSVGFTKYWGYSAYDDTYYELEPEGSFVNPPSMAGGKTAIVIRDTKIYSFSPGNVNSIEEKYGSTICNYSLSQNYPNPFNPSTKIKYQVPRFANVVLKVYDILGRHIATLINEEKPAGEYEIEFNGNEISSGVYFYQLKTDNFILSKKMLLLK